ncbi:hypothetical protein ACH5RR_001780 [Cinchona calisaya]|uniref:Uncharacterized protein n=1 Tax=Cinchona calisaya TaxID=153742 RepID=A0ABD3B5N6_9GENT
MLRRGHVAVLTEILVSSSTILPSAKIHVRFIHGKVSIDWNTFTRLGFLQPTTMHASMSLQTSLFHFHRNPLPRFKDIYLLLLRSASCPAPSIELFLIMFNILFVSHGMDDS